MKKATEDVYRGKNKICVVGYIPNKNEFKHAPTLVKTKMTKKMRKQSIKGDRIFFVNCKKVYLHE